MILLVIEMDCVFCKIVKGEIPSYKIYEDDLIIALLDANPVFPGHALIIPKEHTLDINSISEDVLCHIMKKSKDIANMITTSLQAPGFTFIQNNGFVQEVKHYHLHIIPKYNKRMVMSNEMVYKKITSK